MNKKATIILIGIVALGALAAGLWWWKQAGSSSPSYREESVTRGRIEVTLQSPGIGQPPNRLEVKPPLHNAGALHRDLDAPARHALLAVGRRRVACLPPPPTAGRAGRGDTPGRVHPRRAGAPADGG